jgi:hypothetical protein
MVAASVGVKIDSTLMVPPGRDVEAKEILASIYVFTLSGYLAGTSVASIVQQLTSLGSMHCCC